MPKKRKKGNSHQRAMSFAETVSSEQIKRLEGFVDAKLQQSIFALHSNLAYKIDETVGRMATRMYVLERELMKVTGGTEDSFEEKVAEYEDSITNYKEVAVVEKGDFVRFSAKTQKEDSEWQKLRVFNVGGENPKEDIKLHEGLLGKKKGDSFEIEIGEGEDKTKLSIKVDRISRKEEAKKDE